MNKINKKIGKAVFVLVGVIALAGCTVQSENNIDLQNDDYISEATDRQQPKSFVRTETIKQNNIIASKNDDINYLEQLAHQQINQYRESRNLPPLKLDSSISKQARIHSQNMAQGKSAFSHDGFEKRLDAVRSTITYRSAAENIAYNQGYSDPVKMAVDGWIKSPGHHKNMIGNYNLTGMGIAKNSQGEYYFTQIFILENN